MTVGVGEKDTVGGTAIMAVGDAVAVAVDVGEGGMGVNVAVVIANGDGFEAAVVTEDVSVTFVDKNKVMPPKDRTNSKITTPIPIHGFQVMVEDGGKDGVSLEDVFC